MMDMTPYSCMTRPELEAELASVKARYDKLAAQGLKLNMARGKPSKMQLDAVSDILQLMHTSEECFVDGIDARNYGELAGLACAREYWADVLGCKPSQTFVGGNASLSLMHDLIARAYTHGLKDSPRPWCKEERVKFLCPSPGYDRHFKITENFGFELITVPMQPEGPDMDMVEELVKDPAGYGIDEEMGYGYYFWLNHGATGSYRCYGREGQFIIILPEKNAVIATQAMNSNVQPILDAVWKHILPQI